MTSFWLSNQTGTRSLTCSFSPYTSTLVVLPGQLQDKLEKSLLQEVNIYADNMPVAELQVTGTPGAGIPRAKTVGHEN